MDITTSPAMTRRQLLKLGSATAAGLAVHPLSAGAAPKSRRKPNILLILADDLGFSDIGCFGSEIKTPSLDALAAGGIRYTQMYNCAKCQPSRCSLLTGRYTIGMRTKPYGTNPIIGRILKANGYRTLWAGKNHGGPDPIRGGFDRFYGFMSGITNYWNPARTLPGGKVFPTLGETLWRDDGKVMKPYVPEDPDFYATDALTDRALRWLDRHGKGDKPWFLYMAYNAPHWPLHAPYEDVKAYEGVYDAGYQEIQAARYERMLELGVIDREREPLKVKRIRSWSALSSREKKMESTRMSVYAAMITRMDRNIGRLIERLRAQGELDNTLVLFMSDNGASHERMTKAYKHYKPTGKEVPGSVMTYEYLGPNWGRVANTPLRRHKMTSYEGGICTPMILHWPGRLKERQRVRKDICHFVDILPTLMAVTGSSYPQKFRGNSIRTLPDGCDISMTFEGKPLAAKRNLFFSYGNNAVINSQWKAISSRKDRWQLYEYGKDRSEAKDVAAQHPEVLKSLIAEWQKYRKRHG
jgi:arylsulfatase